MTFSNTTDKNGAIQFIESLCKLGDGGITNDTTLFKQITGYFNQGCKNVGSALLRVDKNWKWDDFNYTDFAIGTINLVDQQRDYALPASTSGGNASTLARINMVRILQKNGEYVQIYPLPQGAEESKPGSSYSGIPTHYKLVGNSIRLSPIPNTNDVTLTNGLEVTFQRSGVDFTTASTTTQPGFPDTYHDLPCYYTAATYLLPINRELASDYFNIYNSRIELLQEDWSNRNDDNKSRIIPKFRSSR